MLTGEGGGGCGGLGGLIVDIRRWGAGVIQKNESPDFRSPEATENSWRARPYTRFISTVAQW